MDAGWDDMVTVGLVVRPHGIRGHVIVAAETDFADERFQSGAEVLVRRSGSGDGGQVVTMRVTSGRPHDGRWIVALEGVATVEDAESLRGLELKIPAGEARSLGPGAYYLHELVGCQVVTAAGAPVGEVRRVDLRAGPPMLVVDGPSGEVLVPLVESICRTVDVKGRVIVIDPPEGLLDLNR